MADKIDLIQSFKQNRPGEARELISLARSAGKATASLNILNICGKKWIVDSEVLTPEEYAQLESLHAPYVSALEKVEKRAQELGQKFEQRLDAMLSGASSNIQAELAFEDYLRDIERQTAYNFTHGKDLKPYLPERLHDTISEIRETAIHELDKSRTINTALIDEIAKALGDDFAAADEGRKTTHAQDVANVRNTGAPKGTTRH